MNVNREMSWFSGVPTFDNGADTFHDGLVRFVRNGRYGLADYNGEIVIAPVYDVAMNSDRRRAKVCDGCTQKGEDSAGLEYFGGAVSIRDRRNANDAATRET